MLTFLISKGPSNTGGAWGGGGNCRAQPKTDIHKKIANKSVVVDRMVNLKGSGPAAFVPVSCCLVR